MLLERFARRSSGDSPLMGGSKSCCQHGTRPVDTCETGGACSAARSGS
ncbi:hypothetical protein ACFPRL_06905 [Pseudoclavibacter helvolus]